MNPPCTCINPSTCHSCPAFAEAKRLAVALARIDNAPAYVVIENGHPHLASSWCVGTGKPWPVESIVFTAPAPE